MIINGGLMESIWPCKYVEKIGQARPGLSLGITGWCTYLPWVGRMITHQSSDNGEAVYLFI